MTFLNLNATTISPYPNLADMGFASDAVVVAHVLKNFEAQNGSTITYHTLFSVDISLRGTLKESTLFDVQSMRRRNGSIETEIWGDVKFEQEKRYLLFLNKSDAGNLWQPIMMSYGIHVEESLGNQKFWIPTESTLELNIQSNKDLVSIDPPTIYKNGLIKQLVQVFSNKIIWKYELNKTNHSMTEAYPHLKSPPSHCSFLFIDDTNTRWTGFPATEVGIYSEDDGDFGISPVSNTHTITSDAVSSLEYSYEGIQYDYKGVTDFVPNCVNGNAIDGNFTSKILALGGTRNVLVQYNDPCNQIANLSGCAGTLAIGGLYKIATHTYDGTGWGTGGYGFVIVNNGVAQCYSDTDYQIIMEHELGHTLGIGHIAGGGTALMNPNCCNNITALDLDCLNFAYVPPAGSNNTNCSLNTIDVTNSLISSSGDNTFKALSTITSNANLSASGPYQFMTKDEVTLNSNFSVDQGTLFTIDIGTCVSAIRSDEQKLLIKKEN